MEESSFSTTLPNSSAAIPPPDVCNQIKPPVQLRSSIKTEIQTSSNDDDDDDVKGDDSDCKEFDENVKHNYVKTQSETVSEL